MTSKHKNNRKKKKIKPVQKNFNVVNVRYDKRTLQRIEVLREQSGAQLSCIIRALTKKGLEMTIDELSGGPKLQSDILLDLISRGRYV